jgi:hypothetical protein
VTHAASTVGQVDIWNVTPGSTAAVLLADVDYKASGTLDLPVADYVIGLDTDNDGTPELTYTVPLATLAIPGGTYINAYANEGATSVDIVTQFDDATVIPIQPNP